MKRGSKETRLDKERKRPRMTLTDRFFLSPSLSLKKNLSFSLSSCRNHKDRKERGLCQLMPGRREIDEGMTGRRENQGKKEDERKVRQRQSKNLRREKKYDRTRDRLHLCYVHSILSFLCLVSSVILIRLDLSQEESFLHRRDRKGDDMSSTRDEKMYWVSQVEFCSVIIISKISPIQYFLSPFRIPSHFSQFFVSQMSVVVFHVF